MKPCREERLASVCRQLLTRFVRIDTCQPDGRENDMADAILACFPADIQAAHFRHSEARSSLVIRIPGRTHENALAFIGHTDTVATGQAQLWAKPPHAAFVSEDGILYGRGAADMKSGVAAMTAAALELLHTGIQPERDVLFCFTADEEAGGMGIRAIAGSGMLERVSEIFICEPTACRPGICEKGALWLKVAAKGAACHASRPELGVNAIEALMRFSALLQSRVDTAAVHPLLGRSSICATKFSGGVMTNILPDTAQLTLDIRMIPGLSGETVLASAHACADELCAALPGLKLQLEVLNHRPAVQTQPERPMVRKVQSLLRAQGKDDTVRGLHFYTDMSQVPPGLAADFVILGPGDDRQAHQLDEHVALQDVTDMARLYFDYICT